MKNQNLNEAKRWLKQAEIDVLSAEWAAKGRFFFNSCFLCQQAAEKALKGYLYLLGERALVTHSTLELINLCIKKDKSFQEFTDLCKNLDRYYIPTRYPDALPGSIPAFYFTMHDGEEAIKASKKIILFVKNKIK